MRSAPFLARLGSAMQRWFLCAVLLAATAARAQSSLDSPSAWELGIRYWVSSGITQWSHNAQAIDPSAGNPTSILTYDELTAHAIELHARRNFRDGWFLRGNAGLGSVRDGSLDDEDYAAGQFKFLDSTSPVQGNRLAYAGIEVGRSLWAEGSTTYSVFAGYHRWTERLDAYGAMFTVNFPGLADLGDTVPAVSNEATWSSLRIGASVAGMVNPKTRFSLDLAWLPYARLSNEDSHWQRSDLGPTPNVLIDGRGRGFQLDLELRYLIAASWEAGAGFRHWWIQSRKGNVRIGPLETRLVELESQRTGVTFSLTSHW
jgi:hypothetical protein